MKLAFLLCVERGPLEQQALLLARSIRRWCGVLSHAPIHAFSPRADRGPGQETREQLAQLGVEHHEEALNQRFDHYPAANKVYACAWAESHLEAEILVFCDTDSLFLRPPEAFLLPEGQELAVQPVVTKGQGSTGPSDAKEPYWIRMYELCGVGGHESWVRTMQDRRTIRSYWNAGLVVGRRSAGVFSSWLECLQTLCAVGHILNDKIKNLDQLALAAATPRFEGCIHQLDFRYNYAIPRRALFAGEMKTVPLDDLVHLHYHRWFRRPGFLRLLVPPLDPRSEKLRWLEGWLPFEPVLDEPLHGSHERASFVRPR